MPDITTKCQTQRIKNSAIVLFLHRPMIYSGKCTYRQISLFSHDSASDLQLFPTS